MAIYRKPGREKKSAARIGLALLFLLYSIIMLRLLVLRGGYFQGERVLELVPLDTMQLFASTGITSRLSILNLWGNVGVFVPLGLFFQVFLKQKNFFLSLFYVTLTSLIAEMLQYILAVGVADVDDLILNVFGGLVGILVYRLLRLLFKRGRALDIACLVAVLLMFGGAFWVLTLPA